MGSGKTISLAGPSVLFVYMIIGFVLFFVMRAMGEILLSNLNYKSFSDFAGDLIGPWAGFCRLDILVLLGNNWYCRCGGHTGYIMHWAPDFPRWVSSLLCILLLLSLNRQRLNYSARWNSGFP